MANVIFLDIGIIIIAATIVAHLAKKFNQPLIPSYILGGLIIGPVAKYFLSLSVIHSFFGFDASALITGSEVITTLSEVGVAFLLFMVGLEINFKHLKDVGFVSTIGGVGRCLLFFFIGYWMAYFAGFVKFDALYVGLIVVFTSTMVVVKILSDKREVDSLHGKILVGILLIEDIIAMLALFFLGSANTLSSFNLMSLFWSIFIGGGIIVLILILSNLVWPNVFGSVASSKELLFLSAIAVCFAFSILFNILGFSIVIGAFIAGLTLGNISYHFEIIGRIKPLRDFFLTLFFVSLGMQLTFEGLTDILPFLFLLFFVVIALKPLLTMIVVSLFGYKKRTAFLTGLYSSQISEFSLILVSQGLALGHVSQKIFNIAILLAIISIAFTSYFAEYDRRLFFFLSKDLSLFEELGKPFAPPSTNTRKITSDVVLLGCNRIGNNILKKLLEKDMIPLVIDYNPRIIKRLESENIPCIYGDIGNDEIQEKIPFAKTRLLISTVKDRYAELDLIKKIRKVNQKTVIILTADTIKDALSFYEHGANYVILPMHLSGHHISLLLDEEGSFKKLHEKRKQHILELSQSKHLE
ncbi:cation:proton antiporter [Candidatus Woesearchaeota archaeon]|nr:cation:proton antiporter [Candidatus Woesearchaeota archaeon]